MAKRYTITIKVDYDPVTLPPNMKRQLEQNMELAIHNGLLDDNQKSIVEQYSAEVTEG